MAISHYNTWYIAQSDIYGNGTAPNVGILCPNETAPVVEPGWFMNIKLNEFEKKFCIDTRFLEFMYINVNISCVDLGVIN